MLSVLALVVPCLLPWARSPAPQELDPVTLERWRAHYAAVERELLARDVSSLDDARKAARLALIATLGAYRERGDFTRNADFPGARVPYFVDHEGRRCAVATLLDASGEDSLVRRVAAANNHVWVSELAGDADFAAWLEHNGLDFDEAVRIQGPGAPTPPTPEPPAGGGARDDRPRSPRPAATPARAAGPTLAGPGPSTPFGGALAPTMPFTAADGGLPDWIQWWELNKLRWLESELRASALHDSDGTRPQSAAARLRDSLAPRIQAELDHPQAEMRAAAAYAFARAAGADSVPELQGLLSDPSRAVRESAILALGLTDSERGVHALLSMLRAEREATPRGEALALVALGIARWHGRGAGIEPVVAGMLPELERAGGDDVLQAALLFQTLAPSADLGLRARCASGRFKEDCEHDEARVETRARALETLRLDGEPSAVLPRLLDALHGRDLIGRRSAAASLAGVQGALDPLLTAFELEEEPLARGRMVLSIGAQGGERAREFLETELERGPKALRPWAALALGIQAGEEWDGQSRAALREAHGRAGKNEGDAILLALGLARDTDAHGILIEALGESRSDRTRMFAAVALGLIGDEEGRTFLLEALPVVSCPFARSGMALALALYGRDEDVPVLMELLRAERRPESMHDLALALGLQGTPATAAALAGLLDEDLPAAVQAAALDALGLALVDDPRSALTVLAHASDANAWPDWVRQMFERPL